MITTVNYIKLEEEISPYIQAKENLNIDIPISILFKFQFWSIEIDLNELLKRIKKDEIEKSIKKELKWWSWPWWRLWKLIEWYIYNENNKDFKFIYITN